MRLHTSVTGPAGADVAWERYADPSQWATWAPQIRSVESSAARIEAGVTGTVHALFGVSVDFAITEVDEASRSWSWTVHPPGLTMHLEHTVEPCGETGSRAALVVDGPTPVVLVYAPIARLALHRLLAT